MGHISFCTTVPQCWECLHWCVQETQVTCHLLHKKSWNTHKITTAESKFMRFFFGLIFPEREIHQHIRLTEQDMPRISPWCLTVPGIFSFSYSKLYCSRSVLYFSLDTGETLQLEQNGWFKYLRNQWPVLKQGLNLWGLKLLWLCSKWSMYNISGLKCSFEFFI